MLTAKEQQSEIFDEFIVLSKIQKLAANRSQIIRLKYQEQHDEMDGNTFFRILGDYLKETTGSYCI